MNPTALLIGLGLLALPGCFSATVKLERQTIDTFHKVEQRLKDNQPAIDKTLSDLAELQKEAIVDQHALSHSLAKAKLLESLKSPWFQPQSDLLATQKEVAFYYLYELSENQRDLLNAKLSERQAGIEEVKKAYARLTSLAHEILGLEQTMLASLDQSTSTQLIGITQTVLGETKAFREQLAASDNPRLKALAHDVQKAEDKIAQAKDVIQKTLAQNAKGR
jgi:hypothetical protein